MTFLIKGDISHIVLCCVAFWCVHCILLRHLKSIEYVSEVWLLLRELLTLKLRSVHIKKTVIIKQYVISSFIIPEPIIWQRSQSFRNSVCCRNDSNAFHRMSGSSLPPMCQWHINSIPHNPHDFPVSLTVEPESPMARWVYIMIKKKRNLNHYWLMSFIGLCHHTLKLLPDYLVAEWGLTFI